MMENSDRVYVRVRLNALPLIVLVQRQGHCWQCSASLILFYWQILRFARSRGGTGEPVVLGEEMLPIVPSKWGSAPKT